MEQSGCLLTVLRRANDINKRLSASGGGALLFATTASHSGSVFWSHTPTAAVRGARECLNIAKQSSDRTRKISRKIIVLPFGVCFVEKVIPVRWLFPHKPYSLSILTLKISGCVTHTAHSSMHYKNLNSDSLPLNKQTNKKRLFSLED